MAMQWYDLLFMHWPIHVDLLRPLIPRSLDIETFDGTAWVGVVPFGMSGVRPRLVPTVPGLSAFLELNVRTYVTAEGKPGVWFFSLDAANPLAVRGARWTFHLPYFDARMTIEHGEKGGFVYGSTRTHRGAPPAEFKARYRPTGPVALARQGSIDHWLTERYCLYSANRRGVVSRGEIHHAQWPLQPATVEIERNAMTDALGLVLPNMPPLLHFARHLRVMAWRPTVIHVPV